MYNRFEDPRYMKWAKAVKVRDNFTCQICGREGVYLNSHHMNSWDVHENDRFDMNNGVCLCTTCHTFYHIMYKAGNNTKAQFEEFKKIMSVVIRFYKNKKEIIKTS
jgi:5-methylcytosine-specific restriction endonuclease McrA